LSGGSGECSGYVGHSTKPMMITGTCKRTKDIDDNTETKTEKIVQWNVTTRLVTKVRKGQTKGRKPDRPREMLE